MSELLGKGTIDKKSSGETKGRQGSSSRNNDVLGRELFTPDEVDVYKRQVYKVIISADKDAIQSSKITNEFAKRLGISEEQLFKCPAENTRRLFPPVVRSMNDIMKERCV